MRKIYLGLTAGAMGVELLLHWCMRYADDPLGRFAVLVVMGVYALFILWALFMGLAPEGVVTREYLLGAPWSGFPLRVSWTGRTLDVDIYEGGCCCRTIMLFY